jgi:hypothetical protein
MPFLFFDVLRRSRVLVAHAAKYVASSATLTAFNPYRSMIVPGHLRGYPRSAR